MLFLNEYQNKCYIKKCYLNVMIKKNAANTLSATNMRLCLNNLNMPNNLNMQSYQCAWIKPNLEISDITNEIFSFLFCSM